MEYDQYLEPLGEEGLTAAPKNISQDQRDEWKREGYSLRDGSYPIPNKDYLERAIQSFGRAPESKRGALKRLIQRRAKALGVDVSDSAIFASAEVEERILYVSEADPFGTEVIVAASFPVKPPREWFDDPKLTVETPLTVTPDGRVFGHIAPWNSRHVGLPGNVRPPRNRTGYQFFNKGLLETAEGTDVTVGQLTLAGGHAPLHADASRAVEHYDNTKSAVADIHVGEDQFGIWAAGAVRPDVDENRLRTLRASVPSGDWRPINGQLELIAACCVNSGGFPIARAAIAASAGDVPGEVLAMVASGAQDMYILKLDRARGLNDRLADLETQVAALTASARKHELRERVNAVVGC